MIQLIEQDQESYRTARQLVILPFLHIVLRGSRPLAGSVTG